MPEILASILHVPDLSLLSDDQREEVLNAYMSGSHAVFIVWVPIMGLCLLLCFLINDRGLIRPDEKVQEKPQIPVLSSSEHGHSNESDVEMQAQEKLAGSVE